MSELNLKGLVEEAIARFAQNRIGSRPRVVAKIPPNLPLVSWHDDGLAKFVKRFLYHALTANDPELPVRVSINERGHLSDLEAFVRLVPLYWIQLRIQGRGSGMADRLVEELFRDFGYRCDEWVGVEGSEAQLAIFSPPEETEPKIVFCADLAGPLWKCDLLIPVSDRLLVPASSGARKKA